MRWESVLRGVFGLLASLAVSACVTTGATLGSGVGDKLLDHAPFYAGTHPPANSEGDLRIGHLPVAYQQGASQSPIFDPSLSESIQGLLNDMTAFLDSSGVSIRLVEGGRVSAVTHAATQAPPDVQFGCVAAPGADGDECEEVEGALGRGPQWMRLAVGRPSADWVDWIHPVMHAQGVDYTLVVTLEIGQYRVRQRGWRGTKEVELGTDHVESLPWLTSLETQVSVLQITGALVGPDGRAVRIGAEGLAARRTSFGISVLGAQELITDEDIVGLRTRRREELPDAPLVWRVALGSLLSQLTGRPLTRLDGGGNK